MYILSTTNVWAVAINATNIVNQPHTLAAYNGP